MSRWNDQFASHAFRSTWISVKNLIQDDDLEKNNNEDAVKEIARLKKVVAYIDSILEQVDPELVPTTPLNSMNQHAANCLKDLNVFKGNQNIGQLHNANNNIDHLIILISQTPFASNGQQKGAFTNAAYAYSEAIDEHLGRLKGTIDNQIGSVSSGVKAIEVEIKGAKEKLEALQTELKTVTQTIEKQTAEFNTQFQANEKSRSDKFEKITDRLQSDADTAFKDVSVKSGKIIEVLEKFKNDAKKILGVVINTAQAGAYSSYANEERRAANWLRWSAFILMIFSVAVLVVPEITKFFSDFEAYSLDWKVVLGRLPLSVILFVPAFYLSRESSRHRQNEIINRRRELILTTIDPYLALLPEERRYTLKEEIAKGIFSEDQIPAEKLEAETSNVLAQIANLIKQLKGIK